MTSRIHPTDPIIYEPEWNPETEKYEDVCPFEKGTRNHLYICKCRHDEGDVIKTWTQFESHFQRDYHKNWRRRFGKVANEEIGRLRKENEDLKKEIAILNVKFEKDLAKSRKDYLRVKMDFNMYKELTKNELFYDVELD